MFVFLVPSKHYIAKLKETWEAFYNLVAQYLVMTLALNLCSNQMFKTGLIEGTRCIRRPAKCNFYSVKHFVILDIYLEHLPSDVPWEELSSFRLR